MRMKHIKIKANRRQSAQRILFMLWQTEKDSRGRLVCVTESYGHFVQRKLAIN